MNQSESTKKIVILGGGFAGVFAARYLSRKISRQQLDADIELISERNYFVFQPLLPEVVAGTINAQDAVTPLRLLLRNCRVRMGEVTHIDFIDRQVEISQGSGRIPQQSGYDHLVIALGQRTTLERFPGFAEHALCLRDLAHAHQLRNQVLQCLEHADVTSNPALRKSLLTFVVAGAGFSGVEVAGELQEMLVKALPMYPNLSLDDVQTIVVQRGQQILPELPGSLGDYAAEKLTRRGLDIRYGVSLSRAVNNAVFTDEGERINCHTLICTVGNGPSKLVESLGLPLQQGRIRVDGNLNVEGMPDVWALGDAASVPLDADHNAPGTAQFAIAEAKQCAHNIAASLRSEPLHTFTYKPRGTMASIGHYQAVADVYGRKISGLLGWLLWRGFYIGMLPGFSTRLRVALNWLFDYFLPRSIVQIKTTSDSATEVLHYSTGDVLFAPGQIIDGFYMVIHGTLESRIPGGITIGEDFVRILGPGDHWGERRLSQEGRTTLGWLTAVDDCEILKLRREDFRLLAQGLPPLADYLKKIPDKIYPPGLRDK